MILEEAEDGMKKAISHLNSELSKIRAGRANPSMLTQSSGLLWFSNSFIPNWKYKYFRSKNTNRSPWEKVY